jgi:hypothetical protein
LEIGSVFGRLHRSDFFPKPLAYAHEGNRVPSFSVTLELLLSGDSPSPSPDPERDNSIYNATVGTKEVDVE